MNLNQKQAGEDAYGGDFDGDEDMIASRLFELYANATREE